MPYPRTEHELKILADFCAGGASKAELARRYGVNRKTVHAVLARYGVHETQHSVATRMRRDTEALTRTVLRFVNRVPPSPEVAEHRRQVLEALGDYEARWSRSAG